MLSLSFHSQVRVLCQQLSSNYLEQFSQQYLVIKPLHRNRFHREELQFCGKIKVNSMQILYLHSDLFLYLLSEHIVL